jgi:hypothetical protein
MRFAPHMFAFYPKRIWVLATLRLRRNMETVAWRAVGNASFASLNNFGKE